MAVIFNPFTGNLNLTGSGVAGSDTQVQFNDNGVFGGDGDLTWNKTTNVLTVTGDVSLSDGGSFTTTVQTITPTANRTISYPDATGTVALVAGSSGQLTYNNAGAQAGDANLTWNATTGLALGKPLTNSTASAASTPAKIATGSWFTGGTATTTKPHFLIEPSGTTSTGWSTSGTGLGVNAASGFTGNLLDLQVNGVSQLRVPSSGGLLISGAGALGYATGAGGTVTQATSKSTGVTLNKACGQITMNAANLAANTAVSFTLTNSVIAATDVLVINHVSGGTTGAYYFGIRAAAGSATITVRNLTAGDLAEALVLSFAVVKAVTA